MITVIDTPEGRVYRPLGMGRSGFIIDARAERRLEAFHARSLVGLRNLVMIYLSIIWLRHGRPFPWLLHHPFFFIVGVAAVGLSIDPVVDRVLLRGARRTTVPRPSIEHANINRFACWRLLVVAGAIASASLGVAIAFPSLDAWLFAASFALGFAWLARYVGGLLRMAQPAR